MTGYVTLNREFLLSEVFRDLKPSTGKVLMGLLPELTFNGERYIDWRGESYKLLHGEALASCVDIAKRCGVAEATVRRGVRELEELGLLEFSRINQGYYIQLDKNVLSPNVKLQPNCTNFTPPTEQKCENTPYITKKDTYKGETKPFKRPKKSPKVTELEAVQELIPEQFTGPNTLKALSDWLSYKQDRSEAYTTSTFKGFMTICARDFRGGKELHDAIYEAIGRQWRGVHNTQGGYNA